MFFDLLKKKKPNKQNSFELSRSLIKESTQLKKTNIEEAIKKIQEAINICPEEVMDDYFKLANYIQIAGRNDESFGILRKLVLELDPYDHFLFNMNRSVIGEKMSLHLFREQNYLDCIWYGCEADWNRLIAYACQGRFTSMGKGKLFLEGRNSIEAFKKLQCADEQQIFKEKFQEFLLSYGESLTELSNLSPGMGKNKPSPKFNTLYRHLNEDIFSNFFEKELQPIIQKNKA